MKTLEVSMVVNEDIRHVTPDKELDAVKDARHKAAVRQKQLLLIQTEAMDFVESVLKPLDGFLELAELNGWAIHLGKVQRFLFDGHDPACDSPS